MKNIERLESNLSRSFGYVKKDLLMLNDAVSEINDKIRHLSLNHATLLEKLQRIEERLLVKEKDKKIHSKKNKARKGM